MKGLQHGEFPVGALNEKVRHHLYDV